MVLALLGSAAGAFAGKGINDMFNKAAADRSFEMNQRLQQNDQNFQREMRATAYQTMVEDMKKAGINPAVALANGAGQAMGGSSSASASAPSGGDADIATAAMGIKQAQAQIDNQTALTSADVANKNAETMKTLKEAGYTDEKIKNAEHERNLLIQQLKNAKTQNEKEKAEKEIAEWESRNPVWARILPATAGATGAVMGAIAAGPIGAGVGFGIGHGFRKPNKIGFNR